MEIKADQTATAIFTGTADLEWVGKLPGLAKQWGKIAWLGAKQLLSGLNNALKGAKNALKKGWDFLKGWYRDDPIGATAGVAAGVLAIGVVVVVGAGVVGGAGSAAFVGGIKSLLTVKGLIGFAAAGAGVAAGGTAIQQAIKWVVRSSQALYNFDWNITDADIRKKQETLMGQIAVRAGGALGTALGGLSCGAVAGVATISINVTLMADLFDVLDSETQEEILSAFTSLIYATKIAAAQMMYLEAYKNIRKQIKANLKTGIAGIDKAIQAWGAKGSKPWILSKKVEKTIETLSNGNQIVQSTIEEFAENFMESCTESLYNVT